MNLKELGFCEIDFQRFDKTKTPYKIYAQLLDETTQDQFEDVLKQEYVTYASLMPDAHAGYSMPIGGICSTKNMIVPQFVGFDIGCGMCAFKTKFKKEDIANKADEIYEKIVNTIPLGFKTHKKQQPFKYELPLSDFAKHILNTIGLKQLGTLGGGNHFIELGHDENDDVWIVIHSGSRGFGHKIASFYMLEAYLLKNPFEDRLKEIVEDWEKRNENFKNNNPQQYEKSLKKFIIKTKEKLIKKSDPDNIKGIYPLSCESELGKEYIKDLNFALMFALENRKRMIEKIVEILNDIFNTNHDIEFDDENIFINRNHNHAEFDKDIGEWIHRKGATHAKKRMMGVIPGNMRDGSFIVKGKGSVESLFSSSHGAGRVLSRRKARESLDMEKFEKAMKGIKGTVDENTLDESPFAYKDIFEVMELQKDLVDIVAHIKPIINIKDKPKKRY
jgi:tRNA-splicing ligase RtcB